MSDVDSRLAALLAAATELAADILSSTVDVPGAPVTGRADSQHSLWVATRLAASVIRPLGGIKGSSVSGADPKGEGQTLPLDERVWQLARSSTALAAEHPDRPNLLEATAALQDLAVTAVDASVAASRIAELAQLQAGMSRRLVTAENGPYLVTNPSGVWDWLGQAGPARPQMALCRCGASSSRPFCDGTHAAIGFSDAKDPNRVADRRDTYVGQQVTVLDNRGLCQHSGLCTDRLATVFHQAGDPFVTPSGGRMDEIIRAVRDCPSGALSYAIDGVEARSDVDHHDTRPAGIDVTKDGPYRVSGGAELVAADGTTVARPTGASDEHFALCRCGHSQNKPFCSGMHWYADFHDPVPAEDHEPTIFEWAGGLRALERMTRLFYERYVPEDPLLAPLFATMSADHPQRVAKWLGEVFCGPTTYSTEYGGYSRMLSQHLGKGLTEEQRTRWVSLLLQSARDAGLPNDAEFRSAFGAYIEWGSRLAVANSQTGAQPPEHMPMPHWDWHTSAGPPGSRPEVASPPTDEPEEVLPADDVQVSYADHIKPLFRPGDRRSMSFAFDLWSYDDVRAHASAILERLENGSMPCDRAWSPAKIAVFERWTRSGAPA